MAEQTLVGEKSGRPPHACLADNEALRAKQCSGGLRGCGSINKLSGPRTGNPVSWTVLDAPDAPIFGCRSWTLACREGCSGQVTPPVPPNSPALEQVAYEIANFRCPGPSFTATGLYRPPRPCRQRWLPPGVAGTIQPVAVTPRVPSGKCSSFAGSANQRRQPGRVLLVDRIYLRLQPSSAQRRCHRALCHRPIGTEPNRQPHQPG